ncbi:MAG: polymer-forming cytoskeletal protein [Candidatus Magasanikbacteria bacterium]|nr:polymer-forming cytoskeletal protein [Candidatus Magasanikbacteria bacterium]
MQSTTPNEVETIVGPSVKVEGDFNSQGNVLIQGMVSGNVKTEKYLQVEEGAKIMASVRADSAKISGEVQGNIRAKNTLELTATARIVGDIEAKTLIVAPGAILHGKCAMLGTAEVADAKSKTGKRKSDSDLDYSFPRSLVDEGAVA